MNSQNLQLADMAFDNLSIRDKQIMIEKWTNAPVPREPDRIVRIRPAAVRLGVTDRTVFNLLASGALTRVWLPGRKRACGVRNSELTALIEGGGK